MRGPGFKRFSRLTDDDKISLAFEIFPALNTNEILSSSVKQENRLELCQATWTIEIINNTRGGIVMFFTEKKGNSFIGGQIQVPDAGPGADWLS